MHYLTRSIIFLYLIQSATVIQGYKEIQSDEKVISQARSSLNCSMYHNDYDILASFPFIVAKYEDYTTKSHAYEHVKGTIDMLWIINETVLPLTVFCLKYLSDFHIYNLNLSPSISDNTSDFQLPPEIECLASSLRHVAIVNTTVNLPEEIGNLKRLLEFTMVNTDLVSLPKTIANIKSLTTIRLDRNLRLRSLESLSGLPNLGTLTAENCSIDRLPSNLPNLNYLRMSENNLTDIDGIGTLGYGTNISKTFDFSSNHIKYIQPEIRFVRHLYHLNLSKNQLTSLPREIFQIITLTVLDISNNLFDTKELNTILKTFKDTHPDLHLIY